MYQFISPSIYIINIFYRNIKQDRNLYFITQNNKTQRYASKVKYTWDFFYMKMHKKGIFRFMLLQRVIESLTDQHNEETVYRRRKLWIAFVLVRSRSCRLRGRLSNGNVAEWTKSTTKGMNGRSSSIKRDQGAKDDTPLVQRGCTCASYSTSTYLDAPQERDKTREKPSMAHSLNCTRYAHVYANALC